MHQHKHEDAGAVSDSTSSSASSSAVDRKRKRAKKSKSKLGKVKKGKGKKKTKAKRGKNDNLSVHGLTHLQQWMQESMAEEFGVAQKQPEEIEETSKSTQAAVEDRPKRRSTPEVASRRLPQRPEEYQLEQNTLRKVYDPMTGRT
ncbi:hypothetical protein HDU84_008947, partial [Entophlyctis sp. JEL0112]